MNTYTSAMRKKAQGYEQMSCQWRRSCESLSGVRGGQTVVLAPGQTGTLGAERTLVVTAPFDLAGRLDRASDHKW
jgi:hypothetical protein